jgi:hypothetical protein
MSCTCQVIRGKFIYIPYIPEGGDPHLEDKVWNKEVITIASTHGFTPCVQECFYELVALALAWLTFIYNAAERA